MVLWRKHLALLIYLACSPDRTRSRDHLMGLLWPEKPQQQARHSLNEAVRRLRRALGAERLLTRGDSVTLNDAHLEVDALAFLAAAGERPDLQEGTLQGDFLEGFNLDDAPAFEEWAARERTRFRARAASWLVARGEKQLAASRFADARDSSRRALGYEAYSEPAVRLLVRSYALAGDVAGALAAYQSFAEQLGRDVGETPGRELAALAQRIREGRWRFGSVIPAERQPPLVGRPAAYQTAFEVVAQALVDGPRVLFVTGSPGMGKTRLVAESAERFALEGATIALARPLHTDDDAPWGTLAALLRGGFLQAPGIAATDPEALGALTALPGIDPATGGADVPRVAGALASAVRAVAEEQPVMLAVDDAHFADDPSLGALARAIEHVGTLPVLLVVNCTSVGPEVPREVRSLAVRVGRTLRGAVVRLNAFTEAEMRELVVALATWCGETDEQHRLTRRLLFETGGNPFTAVTLLTALERVSGLREDVRSWPKREATLESPLPISVPVLVRVAVVARVGELDEEGRRILAAGSIAGQALDLELVSALTQIPADRVGARLGDLERLDLLAFDGQRYTVTPIVAEVARGEYLTPGERQQLRLKAAQVLDSRRDPEARLLRVELLAKAAPNDGITQEALSITQTALAAGAMRTARRALAAAEAASAAAGGGRATELRELRAQVGAFARGAEGP